MIRSDIVLQAATRLGDTSTDFLGVVDSMFDFVLRDLAQAEAIDRLVNANDFDLLAGQEVYSTNTICQLVPGAYPVRILRIWIPQFGSTGVAPWFRQAENDLEYEQLRADTGDSEGQPQLWRVSPNGNDVEMWPPVSAAGAGANLGMVRYQAPPSVYASGDDVEELPDEDLETVIWGLIARAATFRDETMADVDSALQLYERGKSRMWGRLHNSEPKRVAARDF